MSAVPDGAPTSTSGNLSVVPIPRGSGACGSCGYSLYGLASTGPHLTRCPECGVMNCEIDRFDALSIDPIAKSRYRWHTRTLGVGLICLAVWPFVYVACYALDHAGVLKVFAAISSMAFAAWPVVLLAQIVRIGFRLDAVMNRSGVVLSALGSLVIWGIQMVTITAAAGVYFLVLMLLFDAK